MRITIVVVYAVMAIWLLVSAGARIAIQLSNGVSLDVLPFISGAIGILALVLLAPAFEEWRGGRREP